MKKFMERFIEAVRKYEELLSYAQGRIYSSVSFRCGVIGYYYSPILFVK